MDEDGLTVDGWPTNISQYGAGLVVKYGVNKNTFDRMWAEQEGKCVGCEKRFAYPFTRSVLRGIKPQVEYRRNGQEMQGGGNKCQLHEVRGLLCRPCRGVLGTLQEQLPLVQNLMAYLKQHGDL